MSALAMLRSLVLPKNAASGREFSSQYAAIRGDTCARRCCAYAVSAATTSSAAVSLAVRGPNGCAALDFYDALTLQACGHPLVGRVERLAIAVPAHDDVHPLPRFHKATRRTSILSILRAPLLRRGRRRRWPTVRMRRSATGCRLG